jgi:hypothetical protein
MMVLGAQEGLYPGASDSQLTTAEKLEEEAEELEAAAKPFPRH